jgi:threonine/homoserine/homoserine lactone efflux protein
MLRVGGAAYLLWMAWKLATAHASSTETSAAAQPMGFWAAVAFQWVNPKAWVMTVTCMSTYLPPDAGSAALLTLIAMFVIVGLPCSLFWLSFGQAMRQWLQNPLRLRVFNLTMSVALVASLVPMLAA